MKEKNQIKGWGFWKIILKIAKIVGRSELRPCPDAGRGYKLRPATEWSRLRSTNVMLFLPQTRRTNTSITPCIKLPNTT